MQVDTRINGRPVTLDIDPGESLATTLRRHGWVSVRTGCDDGSCGVCTVWLDGRPVLACATLTARAAGRDLTTVEGVPKEAAAFARCLVDEGAEQCGFCTTGLTMTVLALQRELERPTNEAVNRYLAGNLCRCSGYAGQLRAIRKFLGGA